QSGQLVFMTVLGGFSNFFGPIIGAFAFTLLQDQLQSLTQYWRFILGAVLAVIVIAFPEVLAGLAGSLRRTRAGNTARPCCLKPKACAHIPAHSPGPT